MKRGIDIWGLLIVTAITALVWHRAAQQTAAEEQRSYALAPTADMPNPKDYLVTPENVSVTMVLSGPVGALREVPKSGVIPVSVPFSTGGGSGSVFEDASLPLDALVKPFFESRGVAIVSIDPPTARFSITRISNESTAVTLRPIPRVDLAPGTTINPATVSVRLPETRKIKSAEARLNESEVQGLQPGTRRTFRAVEVVVTLDDNTVVPAADVKPAAVEVNVGIQRQFESQERRVRVQLAGPGEDEYTVMFDPPALLVRLQIPTDLIDLLDRDADGVRKPQLIGLVHLGSAEKEAAVAGGRAGTKPIGLFVAVLDGTFRVLECSDQIPVVEYTVTKTTP